MNQQKEIFLAFEQRIKTKIEICNDNNFTFDDLPVPKDQPPHSDYFIICVDDGRFDQDWGGNLCSLMEQTSFTVTHMKKLSTDQQKKLNNIVVKSDQSMLNMKRALLSTFLGEPLEVAPGEFSRARWEPKNSLGKKMFDTLHPSLYVGPKRHANYPFLYQYIEFNFKFKWVL